MNPWLLSISIAYLLGSIPFGYLLVRTFRKQDIRAIGSGNIGATNVARSGAKGLGILTLLLDLAKGAAAVLIAFAIAAHRRDLNPSFTPAKAFDLAVCAAIAAVLGHVFPIWLRFRGGKGVATALGVFLVLNPPATGCAVILFAVVLAISRFVSLASIAAAAALPLFAFLFMRHFDPIAVFGFLFIPLLVIVKHHQNIGRLLNGKESRFGRSKRSGPSKVTA